MSDRRHVSFSSLVASLESGKLSVQKACQEIEACLLTNRYDHSVAEPQSREPCDGRLTYNNDGCHAETIIVASSSNALHTFSSTFLDTMAQPGLTRPRRYLCSCHTPSHNTARILTPWQHSRKQLHHLHLAGHKLQSCCCSSFSRSPCALSWRRCCDFCLCAMHACMHLCAWPREPALGDVCHRACVRACICKQHASWRCGWRIGHAWAGRACAGAPAVAERGAVQGAAQCGCGRAHQLHLPAWAPPHPHPAAAALCAWQVTLWQCLWRPRQLRRQHWATKSGSNCRWEEMLFLSLSEASMAGMITLRLNSEVKQTWGTGQLRGTCFLAKLMTDSALTQHGGCLSFPSSNSSSCLAAALPFHQLLPLSVQGGDGALAAVQGPHCAGRAGQPAHPPQRPHLFPLLDRLLRAARQPRQPHGRGHAPCAHPQPDAQFQLSEEGERCHCYTILHSLACALSGIMGTFLHPA